MDKENIIKLLILALFVASIWIWKDHQKIDMLTKQNQFLYSSLYDYKEALDWANSNIEEANDNIQNARWNAWESYEDMGNALNSLEDIETVSP